jgi:hypothetical protein
MTSRGITVPKWLAALIGALIVSALITNYAQAPAGASHEPANKYAAAGSDIDQVDDSTAVLSETMKVSSPFDLVLSATAECSILTELTTGDGPMGSSDSARAYGSVRLWVEIDGNRVPVASDDTATDNDDENSDQGDPSDIGEVTFCNRAYQRTVSDQEDDGQDRESDFIRTRTANGFNWVATNVGFDYDEKLPGQSNNIVKIELWADFDETTMGTAAADAFVGSRTLIAEPTNLSVHEAVQPQGGAGS